MRTKPSLRPVLYVGALTLAIGLPAIALGAGPSLAQSATVINLSRERLPYGGLVTVTGTASTPSAGQRVELQFAPRGSAAWAPVASAKTTNGGSFRLRTKLYRSGVVRAVGATTASAATATPLTPAGASVVQPSASQPVAVAAKLEVPAPSVNALSGSGVDVQGRLLPGFAWRTVLLEAQQGRAWHTVARAYTRRGGRFDLRFVAGNLGSEHLRVRFAGDASNGRAFGHAGTLTVFRQSVASWYDDAGSTACGFHATMGVANKTLPCGTKVTFVYGGRQVTAVVDDRGPFVPGREWDLNQNTAGALGFGGVDTVWSSI